MGTVAGVCKIKTSGLLELKWMMCEFQRKLFEPDLPQEP